MPFVQVKAIEGAFSQKQKEQVIQKVTDTIASNEGRGLRPLTWVIFEEIKREEGVIEGKELNLYDVQVKVIEGIWSPGQKQKVIETLNRTMASIWGKTIPPANRVKIDEVKSGEWGIAGRPITTHEIMARMAESYDS